jgi:exodeoxyribonuclease III
MIQHRDITLISWNVNGLRAAGRKGFSEWLEKGEYDIVCIQETKLQNVDQLPDELQRPDGYFAYFHCATEKKGYSGTAIYTKEEPRVVRTYFGDDSLLSKEGRIIEMEFPEFTLLNIYFPNGNMSEDRLRYKLRFYDEFLSHVKSLSALGKSVIFVGDVNTSHNEIDLARPKENMNNSGFLRVERDWMDQVESAGFHDTYRTYYPDTVAYTWWSMRFRARASNVGWRFDYCFVNDAFQSAVRDAFVLSDVEGSDHCPVGVMLSV